ncbi:MAG: glycoside hydrolase family 15 protein [Verrucomicrobiota bacterium JB023]|nr:glycoside hydrolase family 15 protein [Verrucomicrobiota bacterium JB023]
MHDSNYNQAIIGNGRSCALVEPDATISFLCLPDFDAPTIFGSLLDYHKGGHFGISLVDGEVVHQQYVSQTNILSTLFRSPSAELEVIDFMPIALSQCRTSGFSDAPPDVIRILKVKSGRPQIKIDYQPRLAYGRFPTETRILSNKVIKSTCTGREADGQELYESAYLYTDLNPETVLTGEPVALEEDCFFLLSYHDKIETPTIASLRQLQAHTDEYWHEWTTNTRLPELYQPSVHRSSLVLKLLQFSPTGSIVAAATTSLPETIGEERNWDYRFCWIRDAAMTVSVMTKIGHHSSATRFVDWVLQTVPTRRDSLQIMYGIRGERCLDEETLDHLSGYHGSSPVRVGNAAWHQQQHDIYGVLLDVIWQDLHRRERCPEALDRIWTRVRAVVRTVESKWQEPDRGIWEIRGEQRHFVFSKVLCWVAIDRAVKIARILGKEDWADEHQQVADEMHEQIYERGWSEKAQAFTQSYHSDELDSANLLLADYGFCKPDDPRYVATVEACERDLCQGGLMFRYKNEDDFGQPCSSFTVCSFWMVKALIHIGRVTDAQAMFEGLLSCANPHGLFAEDLDFETKRHLGNFPQAYSHLALIDCAIALSARSEQLERGM